MKFLFLKVFALSALALGGACSSSPENLDSEVSVVQVNPAGDVSMEDLIAAARFPFGLPASVPSEFLDAAARYHAVDMIRKDYFSHTSPDGRTVMDRVRAQGYGACHVSEVFAWGHPTKYEAMQAWMNSKRHRGSILSERSEEFGVSGMMDPESDRGPVWVVVFAEPGC